MIYQKKHTYMYTFNVVVIWKLVIWFQKEDWVNICID